MNTKAVIEFGRDNVIAIHANESLSKLVGDLESIPGVVLVTQPNYNELEMFIERAYYNYSLKPDLAKIFNLWNIAVEYVDY